MKVKLRSFFIVLQLLVFSLLFISCDGISGETQDIVGRPNFDNFGNNVVSKEYINSEDTMKFTFETVDDYSLILGTSYLMDFGDDCVGEGAALIEGKLLTVFGEPYSISDNEENGFEYIIKATSDDGEVSHISVYSTSGIHIGGDNKEATRKAADALIEYVNSAEPSDFERVRYYMDFGVRITTIVKNGKVSMKSDFLSDDEIDDIYSRWDNELNQ